MRAHRLCRALDPNARTVGLVPVLVTTVILSPFESGLVLPLKNLLEINRLLRQARVEASPAGAGAVEASLREQA